MKRLITLISFSSLLCIGVNAQTPIAINYDEDKAGGYTLPDPLILENGKRVTNAAIWEELRRPEIFKQYQKNIYGRSPERPKDMTFEIAETNRAELNGKAVRKQVVVHFNGKKDSPKMNILMCTPADKKPSSATPLMDILHLYTAPDVPALGPAETPVEPLKPDIGPIPDSLPGNGLAQHPMLYFGECYNIIYLINKGKIIWTYSTGQGCEYDDVWMLTNGNILFTRMQYIAIVTPKKEVVWRYDAPEGTEIHGCQPIGLDKVLFVQNGQPPKLFVVNIKTKAIEVQHDLPVDTCTDKKYMHAQFRRVRYTAQGTYLVPYLGMNRVVEFDKDFNVIWRYDIRSPWAAIRLKNGNTLITDEGDILTCEVNPAKETVWEVRPSDLPEKYRYINTQCCTRLANGNTIICSRGGNGKGPQLVEVTPDKKVVWVLWDWKNFGPASGVQILDDPGIPENPGESEH